MPSYFSNDMTFTVLNTDNGEVPQYSNIRNINSTLTSKTITKAQETTINEIIKSRNNTIKTKLRLPNDDNTFAIIPFQKPDKIGEEKTYLLEK